MTILRAETSQDGSKTASLKTKSEQMWIKYRPKNVCLPSEIFRVGFFWTRPVHKKKPVSHLGAGIFWIGPWLSGSKETGHRQLKRPNHGSEIIRGWFVALLPAHPTLLQVTTTTPKNRYQHNIIFWEFFCSRSTAYQHTIEPTKRSTNKKINI